MLYTVVANEAVPEHESSADSLPTPVPSWEAFFGGAADLLYYHPEVKADFAPFLTRCVGSADQLRRFFNFLFFGNGPCTGRVTIAQIDSKE